MSKDKCLIAETFLAQCKENPVWVKRKEPYVKFIVRLKKSAYCKIKKECNPEEDKIVISRFKRAYNTVEIKRGSDLGINNGELKCDYCANVPKIRDKHTSLHHLPPFNLNRINQHPTVCVINDLVMGEPYAEINPEITALDK